VNPRAVGLVGMPQAPAMQLFVRLRPEAGPLASRLYGIVTAADPGDRDPDRAGSPARTDREDRLREGRPATPGGGLIAVPVL
jgi:hypothetical protein